MILKPRKKPLPLQKLEAAIPRLEPNHRKLLDMKEELALRMKGYIGEKKTDYHLEDLANKATILHSVCLEQNGKEFEMDTILITSQTLYIIESKNYERTITFDTHLKQLIRTDGEKETGYRYPITQAETQKRKLRNWLDSHHLTHIPIHYFIAISEPSTVVHVIGDREAIAKVVGHAENIPNMILEKEYSIQKEKDRKERLNHHQIGKFILNQCKEYDRDILADHGISRKELTPGVRCPACGWLGMKRIYKKWLCPECNQTSRYAHQTALKEYFLLMHPWITNKICRYWLQIESSSLASRIFKECNLMYDTKRRIWKEKK